MPHREITQTNIASLPTHCPCVHLFVCVCVPEPCPVDNFIINGRAHLFVGDRLIQRSRARDLMEVENLSNRNGFIAHNSSLSPTIAMI